MLSWSKAKLCLNVTDVLFQIKFVRQKLLYHFIKIIMVLYPFHVTTYQGVTTETLFI